jgi:hypothetical protein
MPLRLLTWISLLCGLAAAPLAAYAEEEEAGLRYRVRVQAPAELAAMLTEGLAIIRWQDDPQMTAELLQRLADEAVQEARQAVAAEGYFSARVEATMIGR